MPRVCVIRGCKGTGGFSFPSRRMLQRNLWINAVRPHIKAKHMKSSNLSEWIPSKSCRICSKHFVGGRKSIFPGKDGYVPTIFVDVPPLKYIPGNGTDPSGYPVPPARRGRPPRLVNANPFSAQIPVHTDHDYLSNTADPPPPPPPQLTEEEQLRKDLQDLKEHVARLEDRLLTLKTVKNSDKDMKYFTGFPNYGTFSAFFQYVEDKAHHMKLWHNLLAFQSKPCPGQNSRPASQTDREESFFMALVRLKTGMSMEQLSRLFGVPVAMISHTFTSWINVLYIELKNLCELPPKTVTGQNRCESFNDSSDLKIILDCTELFTKTPEDATANKQTTNHQKAGNMYKFLVILSPQCTVTYVASLQNGMTSSEEITELSTAVTELIENIEDDDNDDEDRTNRFRNTFKCDINSCRVDLVIPAFKDDYTSQSDEVDTSEKIAAARIHAEDIINHIKSFQILSGDLKFTMKDIAEQVFIVCAYLANFQTPALSQMCSNM